MKRFDDVQFFGSYRVSDFVTWARALNGKSVRIFAYADSEVLANTSITVVIFCWHICLISESMGHHDSEIMVARSSGRSTEISSQTKITTVMLVSRRQKRRNWDWPILPVFRCLTLKTKFSE
jgi:hypothetical protein